jgi:hypothetical protein
VTDTAGVQFAKSYKSAIQRIQVCTYLMGKYILECLGSDEYDAGLSRRVGERLRGGLVWRVPHVRWKGKQCKGSISLFPLLNSTVYSRFVCDAYICLIHESLLQWRHLLGFRLVSALSSNGMVI